MQSIIPKSNAVTKYFILNPESLSQQRRAGSTQKDEFIDARFQPRS